MRTSNIRGMKLHSIAAFLFVICIIMSGCGNAGHADGGHNDTNVGADVREDDTPAELDDNDAANATDLSEDEPAEPAEQDDVGVASLIGNVLETSDNSVVVIKVYSGEEDAYGRYVDDNTMVAALDDDAQVKINVKFADTARYVLRKVWANGAGGEDSDTDFSEIDAGDLIQMSGHYDGEDFIAAVVVIYRNLDSAQDVKRGKVDFTIAK